MQPQQSRQQAGKAREGCPAPSAGAGATTHEDVTVVGILAGMVALSGVMTLVSLQAQAASVQALLAAFGVELAAQLVLLRLWWRVRQRLRERDAALDELCRTRRQAAQAAAERARVMAFITHELRTPLNGVLGMAALLRGTRLTAEQANYVQAIDNSGRLLLSMVNELLETARAEATGALDTHTPAARQPFEPVRLVEEVCELLGPRAHARGLQLACFVHPRIRGQWLGDEPRLKQILLNLLGNALKFTREGGVTVRLLPEDGGLRFEVADTGPGVPKELEASIFHPFTRAAAHDVAREGGVGLGLAIVRQLVDMMGGRLVLDNRPGEGATFIVRVPLKPLRAAADDDDGRPLAGVRVALVVPPGMHRQVLADYVTALGGTVRIAAPEELAGLAADGALQVIVDAVHAGQLRQVLDALPGGQPAARLWLLLTPEERLALHELMQHPALAGWLLKPVRRRTIVERLAPGGAEAVLDSSVRTLRGMVHRARGGDEGKCRAQAVQPLALLAEDDPVSAQVARILLRRAGWRVVHHADGAALLEDVRQRLTAGGERPACVLLDVRMPGMDGIEVAQAIRQLEHDLAVPRLPLIALTAGDEESERERCLAAGMDDFLTKPLDEEALLQCLARLRPPASSQDARQGAGAPSAAAG